MRGEPESCKANIFLQILLVFNLFRGKRWNKVVSGDYKTNLATQNQHQTQMSNKERCFITPLLQSLNIATESAYIKCSSDE